MYQTKKSDKHNCSTLLVTKEMQVRRISIAVCHLGRLEQKQLVLSNGESGKRARLYPVDEYLHS